MNKILCSTGAIVGRVCEYNYSLVKKHLPSLYEDGLIDGMEFMMIPYYYNELESVIETIKSCNIPIPIIHCDKDVGVLFSECSTESTEKAFKLLKLNCKVGKELGADKMVFHLWGGIKSDYNIEYNISLLPRALELANSYNLKILIENIPCTTYSGLQNWRRLYGFVPEINFVFDTRFGAFHDEIDDIINEPIWDSITHLHISDYSSYPRDFSKIRPILHPGEGVIDFNSFFTKLKSKNYAGTITLESPVMIPYGTDIKKLNSTLYYLKNSLK